MIILYCQCYIRNLSKDVLFGMYYEQIKNCIKQNINTLSRHLLHCQKGQPINGSYYSYQYLNIGFEEEHFVIKTVVYSKHQYLLMTPLSVIVADKS